MAESREDDQLHFEALGIFDPVLHDEDHLRLLRYLVAHGADDSDLVSAARNDRLGSLGLDLAVSRVARLTFADAAAAAGLDIEAAGRLWRALGFPDPASDPPKLPPDAAHALEFMGTTAANVIGSETTLALARVLGTATSRLAEAVVDAFRMKFQAPLSTQGRPYSEVVEGYAQLADALLPEFTKVLSAIFGRHMVAVASRTWSLDADRATSQRELVVGFIDLVGYTTVSAILSSRELAHLLGRFEAIVDDVVETHGGRLVKHLGDGAMFVSDDSGSACRIAIDLLAALGADRQLPPARVGLAAGLVVALHGDYQGPVVNIAARLLGAAPPSAVVVDEEVRRTAGGSFRFELHHAGALKGFSTPPPMFILQL